MQERRVEELMCRQCKVLYQQVALHFQAELEAREDAANQITMHYNAALQHFLKEKRVAAELIEDLKGKADGFQRQSAELSSRLDRERAQSRARDQLLEVTRRQAQSLSLEKQALISENLRRQQQLRVIFEQNRRSQQQQSQRLTEQLRARVRDLETQFEIQRTKAQQSARDASSLREQAGVLREQLSAAGLAGAGRQLQMLQAQLKRRSQQVQQLKIRVEQSSRQANEAEINLRVSRSEHQMVRGELQRQLEQGQRQVQRGREQKQYLKRQLRAQRQLVEQLKQQRTDYLAEVKGMKERYERMIPAMEDKIRQLFLRTWQLQDDMNLGRSQLGPDLDFEIQPADLSRPRLSPTHKPGIKADISDLPPLVRGQPDEWDSLMGQIGRIKIR